MEYSGEGPARAQQATLTPQVAQSDFQHILGTQARGLGHRTERFEAENTEALDSRQVLDGRGVYDFTAKPQGDLSV